MKEPVVDIWIFECDKCFAFQVSNIPFPFKSVTEFEKAIKEPLGKCWNPETIFRSKIKPKVTTKIGTIINPMDKSLLLQMKAEEK